MSRSTRRAKQTTGNPLQAGILKYISSRASTIGGDSLTLRDVPKRYTQYGSLLLLGPTFAQYSPAWGEVYNNLKFAERDELFRCVLQQFPDATVTHVAINAPIAKVACITTAPDAVIEQENVMRSPTALQPLYGDFGPETLSGDNAPSSCIGEPQPSPLDFEAAYWTSTVQLQSLAQVWAPRWTMFSRGNIAEKGRILQDGSNADTFSGLTVTELNEDVGGVDVVDFYVGIGYFAFCYLARGVRTVWGWDINGWSVEGLRRGCIKNGWEIKVIKINNQGHMLDTSARDLVAEISKKRDTPQAIRCVAFWGNNTWASRVMSEIAHAFQHRTDGSALNVRHCNLGLLPTSRGSWEDAMRVLNPEKSGWMHVHENAETTAIDDKQGEIVRSLEEIARMLDDRRRSVTCEHVENVKTYAPGVMHCVFDIRVSRLS